MFRTIRRLISIILVVVIGLKTYQTYQDVQKVLTYAPLVEEVLTDFDSGADPTLILSMIYTETKGREDDVMQASESLTGQMGTITDSRESIRQGVEVLLTHLAYAEDIGVDQWTAVQAYNFGSPYMDYVKENGGENLIKLAKHYSRTVVAPSLGNTSGETYAYYHPIALLHGGELYVNGGNIYYSRQVRVNAYLIKIMSLFQ